ncbi:MAG: hypothetical protein WC761_01290 [Candidatus Paceibacterota bacterium]|jgi:hypothetical protein
MNDLYKEALLDAKKLRQVAEEDARNSIMEKVAPYIKKMIAKEAAEATSFFFEEDDDDSGMPPLPIAADPAAAEAVPVDGALDASAPQSLGDAPGMSDAPLSAVGGDVMNVPMPDADGKITIDFEQLFSGEGEGDIVPPVDTAEVPVGGEIPPAPSEPAPLDAAVTDASVPPTPPQAVPGAPASPDMVGEPTDLAAPVPGEEEEELPPPAPIAEASYNKFKVSLAEATQRVDTAYYAPRVSDIVQESLKNKLFSLLEVLDVLVENGEVSQKQARLNEKRLEFLFMKLKEAGLHNSYNTDKDKKDDPMTRSLKEFAAQLFENEDQESLAMDSVSTGKTGLATDGEMTTQAMKQSGVSPEVDDLFKEEHDAMAGGKTTDTSGAGKAGTVKSKALPSADGGKAQDKPWEEGEPETVSEEVEAKGHAGFGDSKEKAVASPDMFFEIDENELKEAVLAIRKENADKKKAKEAGWETAKPEGKSKAPKAVLNKEGKTVKECGMGGMDEMGQMSSPSGMGAGMGEDLVLNVDLPGDIEDELNVDDLDVGLELSDMDGMGGMGGEGEEMDFDMGGDDMGDEMSSDDDEMSMAVAPGSEGGAEEEEMVLTDDGDEDNGASEYEARMHEAKKINLRMKKGLLESRKVAVSFKKLAEARTSEVRELKKEMAETNLFLSKLLYLNKFLQKEGLTRKVKQQIVEHLDRASTVAEAKDIYSKIKRKLDEAVGSRPAAPMVGSASKPTTAGSAKLQENARSSQGSSDASDPIVGTFERWQKLARISNNNE